MQFSPLIEREKEEQQVVTKIDNIFSQFFGYINFNSKCIQINNEKLQGFMSAINQQFKNSNDPNMLFQAIYRFFNSKFEIMPSQALFDIYNHALFDIMHQHLVKKPKYMDAFFFPDKDNEQKLIQYLNLAKEEINICIFTLTNDDLANNLLALHNKGIKIRIITDDSMMKMKGSDIERLAQIIPIKNDKNVWVHMHNKYVVIDKKIVITGSLNWTKQAVLKNYENVIVLENSDIAKKYNDNFNQLWNTKFQNNYISIIESSEQENSDSDDQSKKPKPIINIKPIKPKPKRPSKPIIKRGLKWLIQNLNLKELKELLAKSILSLGASAFLISYINSKTK